MILRNDALPLAADHFSSDAPPAASGGGIYTYDVYIDMQ